MRFPIVAALAFSLAMPAAAGEIVRVVDGDTLRIGAERIRLSDIDAPETSQAKCRAERRLGERAKGRMGELVADGELVIERRGLDRYGRTLATVTAGGVDVGAQLVAEGLARPYEGRRRSWCDQAPAALRKTSTTSSP